MKTFICILLLMIALNADYIEDADKYTLLQDKQEAYMQQVKKVFEKKSYSQSELQKALDEEDYHPLSDVLRILAYDEYRDYANFKDKIAYMKDDATLLKKEPIFALDIADVMVRVGEYDKVLKMLPREEIVMLPLKQKHRAYYYRAIAKYLKNPEAELSQEFLMIKYKFQVTRDIYSLKREERRQ